MATGKPADGWLFVTTRYTGEGFSALLGDGDISYDGGGARIDVVERSEDTSLTEWRGTDPLQIGIPFLLDAWLAKARGAGNLDVQYLRDAAERLRRRPGGDRPPPLVQFDTGGIVLNDKSRAAHLWWWVANIEWGGGKVRDGRLLRQAGTLRLTLAESDAPRRVPKSAASRTSATHTVKAGETLQRIAQIELGDARRAKDIAAANKIRDWRSAKHLKVGRRLKIPAH